MGHLLKMIAGLIATSIAVDVVQSAWKKFRAPLLSWELLRDGTIRSEERVGDVLILAAIWVDGLEPAQWGWEVDVKGRPDLSGRGTVPFGPVEEDFLGRESVLVARSDATAMVRGATRTLLAEKAEAAEEARKGTEELLDKVAEATTP